MGLEFLARVRRSTIGLALVAGLVAATYSGLALGLALVVGAAWSLANLALLEMLVVSLTRPDRGTPQAVKQAAIAIGGMLPLFGAGGVLLLELPPVMLLAGFLLPFAVILLKALSLVLLDTRAWKALVSRPWRAALVIGAILVVAWWLVPSKLLAPARASGAQAAVATAGARGTRMQEAAEARMSGFKTSRGCTSEAFSVPTDT